MTSELVGLSEVDRRILALPFHKRGAELNLIAPQRRAVVAFDSHFLERRLI